MDEGESTGIGKDKDIKTKRRQREPREGMSKKPTLKNEKQVTDRK